MNDKSNDANSWDDYEIGDYNETIIENEERFDDNIIISSKESYQSEVYKLLSKNYRNITTNKNRINVDTKINNIVASIIHVIDSPQTETMPFFRLDDSDSFPVFDSKFYVYEDQNKEKEKGNDFLSMKRTWNENNAIIQSFKVFLTAYTNIKTRKNNITSTYLNQQFYNLLRPFDNGNDHVSKRMVSMFDKDAFSIVDNKGIFSRRRLLSSNDNYYSGDDISLKGIYRFKKDSKNDEDLSNYQVLDIAHYLQSVKEIKTGDVVNIYPHDYINFVSYNGDIKPKECVVLDASDKYLKLQVIKNQVILFYNLQTLHLNRFMVFYPLKKDKEIVTKQSNTKKNTFYILDKVHDIHDQLKFIQPSASSTLFNAFKKIKHLNGFDVEKLMTYIDYDEKPLSPLGQNILRLIRENLRKSAKPPMLKNIKEFNNNNDKFPKVLENVIKPYIGRFADSILQRIKHVVSMDDGGLLKIVQPHTRFIDDIIENFKTISPNDTHVQRFAKPISRESKTDLGVGRRTFDKFDEIFNENNKLMKIKGSKSQSVSKSKASSENFGTVRNYFNRHIPVQKVFDKQKDCFQWIVRDDIKDTVSLLDLSPIDLTTEVEKHQIESLQLWNKGVDYMKDIKSKLYAYVSYLDNDIRFKRVQIERDHFTIDLSARKKNFRGNYDEVSIDDIIEQGEGFGIVYEKLPEDIKDTYKELQSYDALSLIAEKDAFAVMSSSAQFLHELVSQLVNQIDLNITLMEGRTIVNTLLVTYDESKILKEFEAKKTNFNIFLKKQKDAVKTNDEIRRLETYSKQSNANMVRDFDEKMIENRKNIVLALFSLFIVTILSHRPKKIMKTNPLFSQYASKYTNDLEYHLRYFAMVISVLIKNVDESSTMYPYLQTLQNIKSLEKLRDMLQVEYTKLINISVFAKAIELSDKRVESQSLIVISSIWSSFLPFWTKNETTVKSDTDDKQNILSTYVKNIQQLISQKAITKQLSNPYKFSHEPTFCCFENLTDYGYFLPEDIKILENSIKDVDVSEQPRLVKRKNPESRKLHMFWSIPLDIRNDKFRIDIKKIIVNEKIDDLDKFKGIKTFSTSNKHFEQDEAFQNYLVTNDDNALLKDVSLLFENISKFLQSSFPLGKNKKSPNITEKWSNMTNQLFLIKNPIEKIMYRDLIQKFVRDILILIHRENNDFKLNYISIRKKIFLNANTKTRLENIAESDVKYFELQMQPFGEKYLDKALKKVGIFNVNDLMFPKNKALDDIFENHVILLYVFGEIVNIVLKSLIKLDELDYIEEDNYKNDLPTIISLNEIQRSSILDFLSKIFNLYDKKKQSIFVSAKSLKEGFENDRERKNKEKLAEINKLDRNEKNMLITLKQNGLDKTIGFSSGFTDSDMNYEDFDAPDTSYADLYDGLSSNLTARGKHEESYETYIQSNDD